MPTTGVSVKVRLPDVTITLVPPAPTSTWDGPRRSSFWELLGFEDALEGRLLSRRPDAHPGAAGRRGRR